MTARREFKDPLKVLLDKEAKTCKGCIHLERAELAHKAYCGNPAVKSLRVDQRCDEYEEPDE